MDEREKLAEKARALAAERQQQAEAAQRSSYEYDQKLAKSSYAMRQRLDELKKGYAGTVQLSYSYSPSRWSPVFTVDIGDASPGLKRPFGTVKVHVESEGFYVTDETRKAERYTIPFSKGKTEDQVVEILRGVAAELVLKRGTIPYEFPEWYTHLITIIAALAGVACWGLIAFLGGFWGLVLGWIAMILVYKFLQAAGPVLGALGAAVALAGLIIEGLQKM